MEKQQYVCPKCGNTHYESDQTLQESSMYKTKNSRPFPARAADTPNYINAPIPRAGISLIF